MIKKLHQQGLDVISHLSRLKKVLVDTKKNDTMSFSVEKRDHYGPLRASPLTKSNIKFNFVESRVLSLLYFSTVEKVNS